ncbi:MAG TPA: ABC transporter substrate-binding protein [Bacteroidia bacterium]
MNKTSFSINFLLIILLLSACGKKQNAFKDQPTGFKTIKYSNSFGIAEFPSYDQLFYIQNKDTIWSIKSTDLNPQKKNTVVLSTVFAGFMEALGNQNQIVGVDKMAYYNHPDIIKGFNDGKILEVGEEGALKLEALLALQPAFLIASPVTAENSNIISRLSKSGTIVISCDNFKENHPLARAEWIKLFGFINGTYQKADSLFNDIEMKYNNVKKLAAQSQTHPMVMTDALYSGSWNVPGANSYTARLIKDAGGVYVFNNKTESYTYPLNLETVMETASQADIWIHVNQYKTKSEMLKSESRYNRFKAFNQNKVFNYNQRENAAGGNDFWETGVVRPDLVLSDLVKIFSNDKIKTSDLFFYTRLD